MTCKNPHDVQGRRVTTPGANNTLRWVLCALQEEVAGARVALQKLGGVLCSVELVDSFSSDGQRTAVVVRKVANTPAQYPRGQGLPGKSPL